MKNTKKEKIERDLPSLGKLVKEADNFCDEVQKKIKRVKSPKPEKKCDCHCHQGYLTEYCGVCEKYHKPEKKVKIEELRMKSTLKNPYGGQSAKAWSESFEFTIKLLKVNSLVDYK